MGEVVAEPLRDRLERIAGDLVAAAVEDGVDIGTIERRELGDEPGLPGPRLTGDDDRTDTARVARFGPLLDQNRELPGAADERELTGGDVE